MKRYNSINTFLEKGCDNHSKAFSNAPAEVKQAFQIDMGMLYEINGEKHHFLAFSMSPELHCCSSDSHCSL